MSLKTEGQIDGATDHFIHVIQAVVWKSTPSSKSKKPPTLQRNKRVVNSKKKKMARNQTLV